MRTYLYGKLAYRCKLIKPFPVFGWWDIHGPCTGRYYIVTDEYKINYGVGPTKGEALADYRRMLAADYLFLKQQEAILHPSLKPELDYLQQFVRRY